MMMFGIFLLIAFSAAFGLYVILLNNHEDDI